MTALTAQDHKPPSTHPSLELLKSERAPELWQVLRLKTPTLLPATHTSCVIVGGRALTLIDPASPYPEAQAALERCLEARFEQGARLARVALTHHHPDHIGGVEALIKRYDIEVWAHPETAKRVPFKVSHLLEDGDELSIDAPDDVTRGEGLARVIALHTPGHAPGHLCFWSPELNEAAVGDMVAGEGTILIDPDEGDMQQYLAQLARLERLGLRALWPSHGGQLSAEVLGRYQRHRLDREAKVLAALSAHRGAWLTLPQLTELAYSDAPLIARRGAEGGVAGRSAWAHLIKLEREGKVSARAQGEAQARAWRVAYDPHAELSELRGAHPGQVSEQSVGLAQAIERLAGVLKAVRARCPWMASQTLTSLKRYLIEESSELLEVLEQPQSPAQARRHLDELGDVLLQVTLQATIVEERGAEERGTGEHERFGVREVIEGLSDKLVRRHPHVFAGVSAASLEDIHTLWQATKAQEKAQRQAQEGRAPDQEPSQGRSQELAWRPPSPQSPALSRAVGVSDAAAVFGFDWPSAHGALDKVAEERLEVLDALARSLGQEALVSELGDLLFAAVNACRQLKIDPAEALHGTCERFQSRFEGILSRCESRGLNPSTLSLDELEALWVEAKLAQRG